MLGTSVPGHQGPGRFDVVCVVLLMGISLKPEHLKRCRDIALLLAKYGRPDLVKQAGLDEVIEDGAPNGETVAQAAQERVQVVGVAHAGRVDAPLAFGQ